MNQLITNKNNPPTIFEETAEILAIKSTKDSILRGLKQTKKAQGKPLSELLK